MNSIIHFVQYLIGTLAALVLFGLFRPWLALWWTDYANRKKVLQYYGSTLLGLILLYYILAKTCL